VYVPLPLNISIVSEPDVETVGEPVYVPEYFEVNILRITTPEPPELAVLTLPLEPLEDPAPPPPDPVFVAPFVGPLAEPPPPVPPLANALLYQEPPPPPPALVTDEPVIDDANPLPPVPIPVDPSVPAVPAPPPPPP
jgi:hypothetical protein